MRGVTKAVLLAAAVLAAVPAIAADLPTKKPAPVPIVEPVLPSTWRFEITGYGWASSLAGNSGFGTLPTLDYYAPFSKVLEHLEAALMGSVVAYNDSYIVGLDAIWSRVGGAGTFKVSRLPASAPRRGPHPHRRPQRPHSAGSGFRSDRPTSSSTARSAPVTPTAERRSRSPRRSASATPNRSTRGGSTRSPASPRIIVSTTAGS